MNLVVKPISYSGAKRLCRDHTHARSLPKSSKYYFQGFLDGRSVGLAVWGYGIVPRQTPKHLFGERGNIMDYLELSRYFVYDWAPKNTASKFLSITHRLIKRYTDRKWLYTYAAGFQGLVGTIYQASNYDYIGLTKCRLWYVPSKNVLIHPIAMWHRFGTGNHEYLIDKISGLKKFVGVNFRYIYWVCDKEEKDRLMQTASFEIKDRYPNEGDLQIYTEDIDGYKEEVAPGVAKEIPLVRLPSS